MAFGDIVLLKNKMPLGPFTRTQIQEGLSRGEFTARDLAHTPGLKDWLPLLEVLHHLDREVVRWPRSRESHMLPPLPGTSTAAAELSPAAPSETAWTNPVLPPVPVEVEKPPPLISPLPPELPQGDERDDLSAKNAAVPPHLPAALSSTASRSRPPLLPPAPERDPGPLRARAIAWAIDWAVLFLPVLAVFGFGYVIWLAKGPIEHRDPETARQEQALLWRNLRELMGLVAIGFAWLYAAGLESSPWQGTIGKQAMGLVVTDSAGHRISFLRATGRHAAKYLSALPLFLGFMAALFNSQRLAWHDRLADTRVVKR